MRAQGVIGDVHDLFHERGHPIEGEHLLEVGDGDRRGRPLGGRESEELDGLVLPDPARLGERLDEADAHPHPLQGVDEPEARTRHPGPVIRRDDQDATDHGGSSQGARSPASSVSARRAEIDGFGCLSARTPAGCRRFVRFPEDRSGRVGERDGDPVGEDLR